MGLVKDGLMMRVACLIAGFVILYSVAHCGNDKAHNSISSARQVTCQMPCQGPYGSECYDIAAVDANGRLLLSRQAISGGGSASTASARSSSAAAAAAQCSQTPVAVALNESLIAVQWMWLLMLMLVLRLRLVE